MKRQILILFLLCGVAFANDKEIVDGLGAKISEMHVGGHQVTIDSRFGKVTLKGTVSSDEAKQRIEEVAWKYPGVHEVKSKIEVLGGRASMVSCPTLPELHEKGDIKVFCEGELVEVTGSVSTKEEKDKVIKSVETQMPSMKLIDTVKILRPESDEAVFAALSLALKRERHDLSGLTYRVSDGIATFEGEVSNHRVIDAILATALMVDGVKDIRSEVRVR